jgi:hypothetical protein
MVIKAGLRISATHLLRKTCRSVIHRERIVSTVLVTLQALQRSKKKKWNDDDDAENVVLLSKKRGG